MIFFQLSAQLNSLSDLLLSLNSQQYTQRISYLGNASIGAHTRHIIELLKCVTGGYNTGVVDYLNRVRNLLLETDKIIAIHELDTLVRHIIQPDKQMSLTVEKDEFASSYFVSTTYFREMVYNAEHIIHHLALIRVALREMKLDIVGDDFGMAYSTSKYLASQHKTQN